MASTNVVKLSVAVPSPHGPIVVYGCAACPATFATYKGAPFAPSTGWIRTAIGVYCPRCRTRRRKP